MRQYAVRQLGWPSHNTTSSQNRNQTAWLWDLLGVHFTEVWELKPESGLSMTLFLQWTIICGLPFAGTTSQMTCSTKSAAYSWLSQQSPGRLLCTHFRKKKSNSVLLSCSLGTGWQWGWGYEQPEKDRLGLSCSVCKLPWVIHPVWKQRSMVLPYTATDPIILLNESPKKISLTWCHNITLKSLNLKKKENWILSFYCTILILPQNYWHIKPEFEKTDLFIKCEWCAKYLLVHKNVRKPKADSHYLLIDT